MTHRNGFPIFAFLLAILALLVTAGVAQEEKAPERNPFAAPPGVRAPGSADTTQFVPRDRPAGEATSRTPKATRAPCSTWAANRSISCARRTR